MGPTHRMPPQACPHCGFRLSAAALGNADDPTPPQPGDVTLCIECTAPLQFDPQMKLVCLDDAAMQKLDPGQRDALLDIRAKLLEYKALLAFKARMKRGDA